MQIDAHQHFWSYNVADYSWITDELSVMRKDHTPEDLYPLLRKGGIDGTVALHMNAVGLLSEQGLTYDLLLRPDISIRPDSRSVPTGRSVLWPAATKR